MINSPNNREVSALFNIVRKVIAARLMGLEFKISPVDESDQKTIVNITIRIHGKVCGSMSGNDSTLSQAVSIAAWRAAGDNRFGPPISHVDFPESTLELWIQKSSEPLPVREVTNIDMGLDGIELRRGDKFAYFKPSVPLTSEIKSSVRLLRKLSRKAGLSPEQWRHEGTTLRRTRWDHYIETTGQKSGVLQLHRLRPINPLEPTKKNVSQFLRLAQNRLLNVQSNDGLYLYKYQPFSEKASGSRMHVVRQAGCTYAIAAAAAQETDKERAAVLEESAVRGVKFLLRFSSFTPKGGLYLDEAETHGSSNRPKLGSAALLLLALQFGQLAHKFDRERASLVTAILNLQNSDGSFRCYFNSSSHLGDGASQNFFPGEALLALTHEARRGRADCREAVERAFHWYREYFGRSPATAFVPWQVDTWRRAFEWDSSSNESILHDSEGYPEFVFKMIDWLLQFQLGVDTEPWDSVGGFSYRNSVPGYSTATYAEAIIRAYGLSKHLRQSERMLRYAQSSLLALRFLLRLQINPDTAPLFPDPARAVGGTTSSLKNFMIRSDFDQHTITALMAALEAAGLLEVNGALPN